jgi:hypothetical protein
MEKEARKEKGDGSRNGKRKKAGRRKEKNERREGGGHMYEICNRGDRRRIKTRGRRESKKKRDEEDFSGRKKEGIKRKQRLCT